MDNTDTIWIDYGGEPFQGCDQGDDLTWYDWDWWGWDTDDMSNIESES